MEIGALATEESGPWRLFVNPGELAYLVGWRIRLVEGRYRWGPTAVN